MSTITFRGAFVRFADLRQKEEAGVFARLHLTADMSDPVREAMDWQEIPDCVDQTKLTGSLTGRNMILTPNDKSLRQHEIQMEVSELSDFQLFRTRDGEGDLEREELRFIARVVEQYAIDKVERYLRIVGQAPGALKVAYEKQEELPLEDKQGKLEEPSDGEDEPVSENLTGEALERHNALGAALASAREAAGGTHQKRKGRPGVEVQ